MIPSFKSARQGTTSSTSSASSPLGYFPDVETLSAGLCGILVTCGAQVGGEVQTGGRRSTNTLEICSWMLSCE